MLLVPQHVARIAAQTVPFGKNKIQYRDFHWEIYHSPHFNLYYYKEEEPQLQKVVSFAESAYEQGEFRLAAGSADELYQLLSAVNED